jgi:sulfate adenylyltransferase subunit 2
MTARDAVTEFATQTYLDDLEAEAIYLIRETVASFEKPALLFSGGKDSCVMLHLAEKAFGAGALPLDLVLIDTGHYFPEVLQFARDRTAQHKLVIGSVQDSIDRGTVRLADPFESRNTHQSVTLLETIAEQGYDALLGGGRRDEEKARAKERLFSHRDKFGRWDPKNQRPELWQSFNTKIKPGEHFRVFPISNFTELAVWQYIQREQVALPSLYFAHQRQVFSRKGLVVPVTPLTQPTAQEIVQARTVRFRTVGDMSCTCPVLSDAATLEDIVAETRLVTVSERGATRLDDQTSASAMEQRKREGYF